MEKLKRYVECYIPIETCNLRCHYCYIAQTGRFSNKIPDFRYSADYIRKALSVERLGGVCLLNLCAGGETLLSEKVIDIIEALLAEGHYLMVVTNGILSHRFSQIAAFSPQILRRLIFKFSFHYLELLRLKKINDFFDNVNKMREVGCSVTVELTSNDEIIPYIKEIKELCIKKAGAWCQVTIARKDTDPLVSILTEYPYEKYKALWSVFNSPLFDFKTTIFYKKRKEFCYAGDWSIYVNIGTGEMRQCYKGNLIQNIYKNTEEPLRFIAVGKNCSEPHCYNGHAFMTLGVIPEIETPTYAEMRNRKCLDGTEWLNPDVKAFFECKLKDNNSQYPNYKKKCNYFENTALKVLHFGKSFFKRVIKKLKKSKV